MAINLGNITFGIIPNTASLGAALSTVARFSSSVGSAFGSASSAAGRFVNAMGAAQQAANRFNVAQQGAVNNLRQTASTAVLVAGPLSGIASRISVLATLTNNFSGSTAAMVAGVAAGTGAFLAFATAAISVEKRLQTIEQTLTAVSGSSVIAQTQMKYLTDFADRAGVKVDELAKGFGSMQAAAKGTILEGERTRQIFEAITLAGGKLGLSGEEIKGTLVALQQIMSKGKVSAEELRQQLGDRLPGAVQIMASALGVTTQKLDGMMRKGELGIGTLVKFSEELKKRYNIGETTKIDTIQAAENRLYNARMKAIDQLDKVIGFSNAYKNVLNALTEAISGQQTKAAEYVNIIARVGVALAAAFILPRVLDGIAAITLGIGRLAAGILTLNAVSAAGAFTSFIRLFATAAIAIAGYYASEKLIQNALGETKQSYLTTLPAIEAYIDAQKKLTTTDRTPTLQYIEEQKKALDELSKKREELAGQMRTGLGKLDLAEKMGATDEQVTKLGQNEGLYNIRDRLVETDKSIDKVKSNLTQLDDILQRQGKAESTNRNDPIKELTDRQNLAIKNAKDTVKELDRTYENMFKAPAAKEWGEIQNDLAKKVENFRDQLTRTGLAQDKVSELTNNYAAALRRVKEADYALAHTTSFFQAAEGLMNRGLDTGLNNWVDTILEGKDRMEALKDTAKAVAADILKTFLTLAALNPLKNWAFGTNYNTMGGNAGVGGFFGNLFGGSSGAAAAGNELGGWGTSSFIGPMLANGGVLGKNGIVPFRSYANGGIASSPQFAQYGEGFHNEAYVPLPDGRSIPVNMRGGGGGGVELHVHEAPGTKVGSVQRSQSAQGGDRLDIQMKTIAVSGASEDISQGGLLAQTLEKQYGLKRTTGMGT